VSELISFNSPASIWEEALPLGNGRLGAMVFGIPDRERIQLNEDSVWSGFYRDRGNSAARDALPVIRRLLDEGRVKEAEERCLECFSGVPASQRVYQSAGELLVDFSPNDADSVNFGHPWSGTRGGPIFTGIKNYRRELDIAQAVHTLSFEHNGIAYKRECFISAPADILALRFSAAAPDGKPVSGKISFRASLGLGVFSDRQGNTEDAAFITRDSGIPFCVMVKAVHRGGELFCRGGFLAVKNADEALLLVDIRTGFREEDYTSACASSLNRIVNNVTEKGNDATEQGNGVIEIWDRLYKEQVREYRSWYSRMELELPGNAETVRYFNFCRYLLVSSSRPGTLPANLQGIWNPHNDPPWGSDYTININTQMNYWPSCMCNLAETEEPLFDLLEQMYPRGKNTAETMYGCRGFAAHHNTDIWGDTSPRDYWLPGTYWVLGAAWLTLHIREHYEYTLDRDFLARYFYLLKEASVFFADFLIPGKRANKNGEPCLAVSPSLSPENSYLLNGDTCSLCAGSEMDNQILQKLFDVTIRSAEILGITDNDVTTFRSILARIPDPAIHSNGTIREWNDEYEEAEPGHRHFSHLWALCPGDAITVDETPELAAAARKTLERRLANSGGANSGGHTGWSRAWLVNFFARLKDGEAALENLNALFCDFTLPNLFNNGPPFQIDGNFGALAGITQMLVQSRIRYGESNTMRVLLDILPALPQKWPAGRVKGLRSKGNLEIDLQWQDSRPVSLVIRNNGKTAIPVILRAGENRELVLEPGENKII